MNSILPMAENGAEPIASGQYPVILKNSVMAELLEAYIPAFYADRIKNESFLHRLQIRRLTLFVRKLLQIQAFISDVTEIYLRIPQKTAVYLKLTILSFREQTFLKSRTLRLSDLSLQ